MHMSCVYRLARCVQECKSCMNVCKILPKKVQDFCIIDLAIASLARSCVLCMTLAGSCKSILAGL